MWTFIIIVSGVILSVYGLTQSIRQRKHPQEKKNEMSAHKNVSQKRNVERYYNDKNDDDGEMSEEEMIAEDYYFYSRVSNLSYPLFAVFCAK